MADLDEEKAKENKSAYKNISTWRRFILRRFPSLQHGWKLRGAYAAPFVLPSLFACCQWDNK